MRQMINADYEKLFVSIDKDTKKPQAIDYLRHDTGRSHYNNESLEDMRVRYPDIVIMTDDEYRAAQVEAYRIEPEEITKERYWEMLECLPPLNMSRGTFAMSEFYTGKITSMFCQIGERYFHLRDEIMPAEKIIQRVLSSLETGKMKSL